MASRAKWSFSSQLTLGIRHSVPVHYCPLLGGTLLPHFDAAQELCIYAWHVSITTLQWLLHLRWRCTSYLPRGHRPKAGASSSLDIDAQPWLAVVVVRVI